LLFSSHPAWQNTLCHHQLVPARGGPPWTFINLDWCPSSFQPPKPILNLHMAQCLIPKSLLNQIIGFWARVPKFLAKRDADAPLNFLGCQCDTHNIWFWLTASDSAMQAGGNNSHTHMEVQGHMHPTPGPKSLLV
jgi:hypothetical protein